MRLLISPGGGKVDSRPDQGITVKASGGKVTQVVARTAGRRVSGKLNAAGTVWHSTWALSVSQNYTVTATAVGSSGEPVIRTSRFRTFTPTKTFTTQIIEGYKQTYGVGMPIILCFEHPVANRAAVERALETFPGSEAWW